MIVLHKNKRFYERRLDDVLGRFLVSTDPSSTLYKKASLLRT